MENINETTYQQQIEVYKKKYLDEYEEGLKEANDKNYFRANFKREILGKKQNEIYNSYPIFEVVPFRNEKLWLKNIAATDSIAEYCQLHKQDLDGVLDKVAEYEGILLAWQEIDKVEPAIENKEIEKVQVADQNFKLNEAVISKIDLIRIINALWELRAFVKDNGTYPTKQDSMKRFGNTLGIDLSNYDKDLSKALNNSSVEINVQIFKKMEGKITSICANKN